MKKNSLMAAARLTLEHAYAPYSKYRVGAAIETTDGRVFTGCNIENASYGLTICAERVALGKAVSSGARKFKALAVFAPGKRLPVPCGACRQVLAEFAPKLTLLLSHKPGQVITRNLADLFPAPFQL